MATPHRVIGALTAALLTGGLLSPTPVAAETNTFTFSSTSKEVITAVKVNNGAKRMRLVLRVRPGVRDIDNWSWYLDVNRKSRAGWSDDFYVSKQTGYKPFVQKFFGNDHDVACPRIRSGLLPEGKGAWVSVPQRCLVDKKGNQPRRVRVWTEAAWGSTADRAPGGQTTHAYTAWVLRG